VAIGLKRLVFVDDYAIWRAILVQRSSRGENPGTASNPASTMNPIFADAGIPFRFRLSGNRLFNGHGDGEVGRVERLHPFGRADVTDRQGHDTLMVTNMTAYIPCNCGGKPSNFAGKRFSLHEGWK
jgi:hypothetical protein